tara:strand:+ start:126 stop:1448 length:1323 start_codon:yes stop_codon:yes gene_type:complete
MSFLQKYENKNIAIYGMGKTGCSAAKTLKRLKAKVYCWDDNEKVRKKVKRLNFNLNKFWVNKSKFHNIIISPGIDINNCKIEKYLKKNLNKLITDLDIFFELNKNSLLISITGTNGKSTTCKIIEKILKTAKRNVVTVGNIGKPILSFKKIKKNYIFILEVSSYQLQYSRLFRSKHAAILNISPDHLERHGNLINYIKTKSKIFFAQNSTDYSYINIKNIHSKKIKNIFKRKKIKSNLYNINSSNYNFLKKKINNIYFKSKGNFENLSFAYQILKNLKINEKIIIDGLNKFKGLPHRQEIVFSNKKLLCINDSKATSFDASLQSLSNYEKIYWIVGGLSKYKDKFNLKNIKNEIIKAYIIGKNTTFFTQQIKNDIPFTISRDLKNAVNSIYNDIKFNKSKKNTILFSPAAASYDQFKNFEDRGTFFKKIIIKKFKRKLNV